MAAASSNGPPPQRTGAPAIGAVPAEGLCTGCHSGNPVNTGGSVTLTGAPAYYTPGAAYTITVNLASTQNAVTGHVWGFELTAVKMSDGTGAGTFANVAGQGTTIRAGTGSFNTRSYIGQASAGQRLDVASPVAWQVSWTAPASAGPVSFYVVGNAADGDGGDPGDWIYNASFLSKDVTPTRSSTWGKLKSSYR